MEPTGRQSNINVAKDRSRGSEGKKNIHKDILGVVEPGTTDFGGGFNKKSGTRHADNPKMEDKWQGITEGGTKHKYGRGGENRGTAHDIPDDLTEGHTNKTYPGKI